MIFWAMMASSSVSNMISSSASHLCLLAQNCHQVLSVSRTHMKQSSCEVIVISMSSSSSSIDSSSSSSVLFLIPPPPLWQVGETVFELIVVIWDISSYWANHQNCSIYRQNVQHLLNFPFEGIFPEKEKCGILLFELFSHTLQGPCRSLWSSLWNFELQSG